MRRMRSHAHAHTILNGSCRDAIGFNFHSKLLALMFQNSFSHESKQDCMETTFLDCNSGIVSFDIPVHRYMCIYMDLITANPRNNLAYTIYSSRPLRPSSFQSGVIVSKILSYLSSFQQPRDRGSENWSVCIYRIHTAFT